MIALFAAPLLEASDGTETNHGTIIFDNNIIIELESFFVPHHFVKMRVPVPYCHALFS